MKQKFSLLSFLAIAASTQLQAANLTWDPSQTPLTPSGGTGTWDLSSTFWSNGATDAAWSATTGLLNIATFGGTAGTVTLGTNLGAKGLVFGAAGYTITGSTLTLGTSGINASGLSSGTTTISSNLTLASGGQAWNVGAGSTLALTTGTFTHSAGATLNLSGAGTVAASMTGVSNTNGILGSWATVGSGTSTRYATLSGGNLIGYTGATTASTSGSAWGGIPSGGTGAINYDITISGTPGATGLNRNVNTIRYTGSGMTQGGNTNALLLNTNGIMNAGTGTLVIGGAANQFSIAASSTATNEMVLAAANANITINATMVNNGANASGVTVTGPGTVTLVGNNTFTGNLVINSGTLAAGTGQGSTPTASNLGALQPAANRNIIINDGGTLSLTGGNVLGTGGSTNTLSNTSLVVNSGGVFQTGLNGSGAGWWNKIGATTLNGGTIHVGSGANTGAFQGLALIGNVTVAGNSVSTIDNYAASNSASNGVHLGQNATAGQIITFDVADVTGSSASDLNVSTKLLNTSSTLTASGLTKIGAGTMTLSATNAYTGATTISAGTLQIGNGTTDGSISTSSGITNNGALVYNLIGSQSYANNIGGSGTLTKAGAGSLTLSGTNTYAGATTVDAGTLAVNGSLTSNIGVNSGGIITGTGTTTGSLTLNAGSTFSGNTSGILTANGVTFTNATNLIFNGATTNGSTYDLFNYGLGGVSGLGNVTSTFRATLFDDTANTKVTATVSTGSRTWNTTDGTWESGGSGTNWQEGDLKYFDGDTVTFGNPASASNVNLVGTLLPAGTVTVNNTNAYTFSGSGSIGGTASLAKSGSGDLTISNTNIYSGGTTLTAGTINANSASALGNGAIVVNGGTLNANNASALGVSAITVNGGTLNVNNATGLGTGALTMTGGALDNTSGSAKTLTTNNAQNWNGDFAFTGSSDLNMGTGNVTVGGTGTRTVTVNTGTLTVGKISSASQDFTKDGAGTLAITTAAASTIGGTLNVANGILQFNTGSTSGTTSDLTATGLTGSGTIANGGGVERWLIITNATDNNFAGTLANGATGALGFSKQGAGTMTLSGSNSYTGTTTVGGGTLVINGANTGTGTAVNVGANTLVLGNANALGAASTINVSNGATLRIATDGGDTAYSTNFGTGTTLNVVLDRATAGAGVDHALGGATYGGGTVNFTSGANVTSGTASVSYSSLSLTAGTAQTTLLNPTNTTVAIGSVTIGLNNQAKTLGLGGTSAGNEVSGSITNGVGTVAVTKSNTSTWTLSGNSTYTGATTVSAGTLLVNGSLGDTAVSVSAVSGTATLGGSGTIGTTAASLTVSANGILAPGNSPGTLTVNGSTTLDSGSTFAYQYTGGGSAADLVDVNGTLSITSGALLTLEDLGAYNEGDKFTLFAYDSLVGSFDSYLDDTTYTFNGGEWMFDYNDTTAGLNGGSGTNYITITAVPEPAAALLGGLGMLALLRRRRDS